MHKTKTPLGVLPTLRTAKTASQKRKKPQPEYILLLFTAAVNTEEGIFTNKATITSHQSAEKSAVFYEGESVFNLLVREMKKKQNTFGICKYTHL